MSNNLNDAVVPYCALPKNILQSIDDPDALGIWVYLWINPDRKVIPCDEVMDHFALSYAEYRNAKRYLIDNQLMMDGWQLVDNETRSQP